MGVPEEEEEGVKLPMWNFLEIACQRVYERGRWVVCVWCVSDS